MKSIILLSIFVFFTCVIVSNALIGNLFDRNFLVSLNDNVTCDDNSTQALKKDIIDRGGKIVYDYCNNGTNGSSIMQGFLVSGKKSLQDYLAANKQKYGIKQVSDDTQFIILQSSNCTTQSNAGWCLARLSDASGKSMNFKYSSSAGQGVTLYYLDTGVKSDHPEFEGRVTRGNNYVAKENNEDKNGHGTGTMSMGLGKTVGVAKKATGIMHKVCDEKGNCMASNVLKGLQAVVNTCTASGKPLCILNLSLGGPYNQIVNDAIGKALENGVLSFIAAGNDQNNACKWSPASYKYAVTVAASTTLNTMAAFSGGGECVDLIAPGEHCLMADGKSNRLKTASGTSFATPLAAGAAALILADNPTINAAELANKIVNETSVEGKIKFLPLWLYPNQKGTPNKLLQVKC